MPNTITGLEAIELVAGIVSDYNPYREPELSSTYNGRIRNQAVAFIESVFCQASLDRKPFDGHFDRGYFEYSNEVGKIECASISGSTFDSELLCQLAQKHYMPLSSSQKQKQASQKRSNKPPKNAIKNSEEAIAMTDKLWGRQREMKNEIREFVIKEAQQDGCTCTHIQMYGILESANIDGKMLLDTSVVKEGPAKDCVKKVYAEEVSKDRIATGRPPKKNTCPVHK